MAPDRTLTDQRPPEAWARARVPPDPGKRSLCVAGLLVLAGGGYEPARPAANTAVLQSRLVPRALLVARAHSFPAESKA